MAFPWHLVWHLHERKKETERKMEADWKVW